MSGTDPKLLCPKCGSAVNPQDRVCPESGTDLTLYAPVPAPVPPPAQGLGLRFPWSTQPHRLALGDSLVLGRKHGPYAEYIDRWKNVSASHCRLHVARGVTTVQDGGPDGKASTNGTYVNETRLSAGVAQPLMVGDKLRLGRDNPSKGLWGLSIEVVE